MKLLNRSKNTVLLTDMKRATIFNERGIGLLKHKELLKHQGLWILPCRSVHTFFMKFSIDVAFVDKKLKVKAVYENVKPWRLVIPLSLRVKSVFELASGTLLATQTKVGDQLHVVD